MPISVFISYSHRDRRLREELEKHLANLKRQQVITSWYDGQISPGTDWKSEIMEHLRSDEIILLLISADFMASDFCYSVEMTQAIARHEANQARVIPIILRPTDWKGAPLASLKLLPTDGKAVTRWPSHDDAFEDVVRGIRQAIDDLSTKGTPPNPSSAHGQVWNVLSRRNPFFTGREQLLTQLHDTLTTTSAAALTQAHAISGLGGIGKTQTAVEYAYRYRDEYRFVLWANASTQETLIADFVTLAGVLDLPEKQEQDQNTTVAAVKQWLAQHEAWLLILDNADDLEMAYDYLPAESQGHILLTTRAQAAGALARSIEVDKMDTEEGALLLLRRAKVLKENASFDQASERDRRNAKTLVGEMDGLPLALDQAGAYIEETGCSVATYLELYRKQRSDLLHRRGGLKPDHPLPVASTWLLSFQKVEAANPAAADLLRLCAFLAPDAIPEELITAEQSRPGRNLQSLAKDPLKFQDAVRELRRYSLVRRNLDHELTIHRLVQEVLKASMTEKLRRTWAERAVQAVNSAFPDDIDVATWPQCQRYLPHAQACADLISEYALMLPEAARLLNQAAFYLYTHALYAQAEPLYHCAHVA